MILLPREIAGLEKICAKGQTRYALAGVYVKELPENGYEACASDGRRLLLVTGKGDPKEFPEVPGFKPTVNSLGAGILPIGALSGAAKSTPKRTHSPGLEKIALSFDGDKATLVTTDLNKSNVSPTCLVEGNFPDYQAVLPKEAPRFSIVINPDFLAELCKIMGAFTSDRAKAIALDFHGEGKAVVLRVRNSEKQVVLTGLLMPLTIDLDGEKPVEIQKTEETEVAQKEA